MALPQNALELSKKIYMYNPKKDNYKSVTPQEVFGKDCVFIDNYFDIVAFDGSKVFWKKRSTIISKDFPYKPIFKTKYNNVDPIFDLYAGIGVWKEGYVCWIPEITEYRDRLFEKPINWSRQRYDPIVIGRPGDQPYMIFTKYEYDSYCHRQDYDKYDELKSLCKGSKVSDFQVPPELTDLIHFNETLDGAIEWQKTMREKLNVQ
jgi:hypothetical protein